MYSRPHFKSLLQPFDTFLARIAVALLLAVLVGVMLIRLVDMNDRIQAALYRARLQNTHATSTVRIAGTTYFIKDGDVVGSDIALPAGEERRVLAMAYALEVTRAQPVLGIAGTDPAALKQAVQHMRTAQQQLATLQTTIAL